MNMYVFEISEDGNWAKVGLTIIRINQRTSVTCLCEKIKQ